MTFDAISGEQTTNTFSFAAGVQGGQVPKLTTILDISPQLRFWFS